MVRELPRAFTFHRPEGSYDRRLTPRLVLALMRARGCGAPKSSLEASRDESCESPPWLRTATLSAASDYGVL